MNKIPDLKIITYYIYNFAYFTEHCRADILIAEDVKQLDKFPKIKEFLPNVKAAVQYTGTPTQEGILSWQQILEIGI